MLYFFSVLSMFDILNRVSGSKNFSNFVWLKERLWKQEQQQRSTYTWHNALSIALEASLLAFVLRCIPLILFILLFDRSPFIFVASLDEKELFTFHSGIPFKLYMVHRYEFQSIWLQFRNMLNTIFYSYKINLCRKENNGLNNLKLFTFAKESTPYLVLDFFVLLGTFSNKTCVRLNK